MAIGSRPLIGIHPEVLIEFDDNNFCRPCKPCYRDYADWTSWRAKVGHMALPAAIAIVQSIVIATQSSNPAVIKTIDSLALILQVASLATVCFCRCVVPEDPPGITDGNHEVIHISIACHIFWLITTIGMTAISLTNLND